LSDLIALSAIVAVKGNGSFSVNRPLPRRER
jgi:hypothetical protein